jgi:hypothetical protein
MTAVVDGGQPSQGRRLELSVLGTGGLRVRFRRRLRSCGRGRRRSAYDDGCQGLPSAVASLASVTRTRPRSVPLRPGASALRAQAAPDAGVRFERTCDELIRRIGGLGSADPPLNLRSHPVTRKPGRGAVPAHGPRYKHREDLIDACLSVRTAALRVRHRLDRCQLLGLNDPLVDAHEARASITALRGR